MPHDWACAPALRACGEAWLQAGHIGLYRVYIGIIGYIYIYVYYRGINWDNGKENGDHYNILGFIGIMENKMEATI